MWYKSKILLTHTLFKILLSNSKEYISLVRPVSLYTENFNN